MKTATITEPLMTARECAALIGYKVSTLKKWRSQKKGPPYIKGRGSKGSVRYRPEQVRKWLAKREVVPVDLND